MFVHKVTFSLAIGYGLLLIGVMVFTPVDIGVTYAQDTSPGNSTSNNASITLSAPKKTSPYQGDSIKLFVISSLVREDQWKPIDNLTSHAWDIKAMVPFNKRYIVILEKDGGGNETQP